MSEPKVSILIPVFNPCDFLRELLTNLNSDRTSKEIIVIDDGSTEDISPFLAGSNVTVITQPDNGGPAAALNRGLQEASGEFVTFVDQDDLLSPNSLKWRLEWLEQNPTAHAVMGNLAGIIDSRKHRVSQYRMLLKKRLHNVPDTLDMNFFKSGGWVPLSPLSLCLFKRSSLEDVGLFDETLRHTHDREYLYRIVRTLPIKFVNRPVTFYRLHKQNTSIKIAKGKITPKKRTVAELFLINKNYGIPFPK